MSDSTPGPVYTIVTLLKGSVRRRRPRAIRRAHGSPTRSTWKAHLPDRPSRPIPPDLFSVLMCVAGVQLQPSFPGIDPLFGVDSSSLPVRLADRAQEFYRRCAGRFDHEKGSLDRTAVVPKPPRVQFLIETTDHRRLLRHEPAEPDRSDHFAIGQMVNDLSNRPFG